MGILVRKKNVLLHIPVSFPIGLFPFLESFYSFLFMTYTLAQLDCWVTINKCHIVLVSFPHAQYFLYQHNAIHPYV